MSVLSKLFLDFEIYKENYFKTLPRGQFTSGAWAGLKDKFKNDLHIIDVIGNANHIINSIQKVDEKNYRPYINKVKERNILNEILKNKESVIKNLDQKSSYQDAWEKNYKNDKIKEFNIKEK
jgi:hypothetical protein